ncbi:hypothetical protein PHYSODRAFT_466946 [Phytophthora sojae]|uniref:Uncharacterized protein n=1 Tax=Phytophthora sojae (strain P6497) TaxID=1094619 RepID=G4YMC4_PHYSP|nr:hypothetical protein PHYSODRAFT_466946 [Phytophthora sojae]EGZ28254.1 hypothetical protein PHYSODRAFT_466946 [Phytophthora sojae]|eukprot:XP_009515529.1 hypothetical protein PHYSODRAFT_466946 [Phytophthora sojae]
MQSQQQQQPRQGGSSGGGGAARRSLVNPFTTPSGGYQQQSSFLQYPAPMEPSFRSYGQPQQPPAYHQQISGRYWQPPTGVNPSSSSAGKQRRHGGSLDLSEFSDILDTNSVRSGGDAAPALGGAPSEAASEMSMASFDVQSFHDGMTGSTGGAEVDTAGFQSAARATGSTAQSSAASKAPTRTMRASAEPETMSLVDAAYMPFNESCVEPDLTTEKLPKDRNERCQFYDCPNRARVSQSYGNFCNRHVIVAPCGFPGCRDKAMERAAMCAKHMELGKQPLQAILDARTQNVLVCKMSGCFKNDQGRGYCRGHEKLLMATGRLPAHINKRRLNSAYTMCSYPDCNKHSQRHHLCRTHGNLIIKEAQELANRPDASESYEEILSRMQKDIRRCTHENCTKNSQRDRLCTVHYYEKHHLRKDGSMPANAASDEASSKENVDSSQLETGERRGGSDIRDVERTRCETPGCGNLSYAAGLCVEHTKESQNLMTSQGRYDDPFSSEGASGIFSTDLENETKQGLFSRNRKPQTLDSQAQQLRREQELAEAAAVAAAAVEAKQASPSSSAKARKYYCKVDGCDKQAQKRNLCKRHYRQQESLPTGKPQPEVRPSGSTRNYLPRAEQSDFPQPTIACRFPGCSQIAGGGGALLCLAHSKATFCWQPGCENLVNHQCFCDFHAFRRQCAYEGCMYTAERDSSGCMNHVLARRCRHEFCDKFAVGLNSDWCRLHQISCQGSPCTLCRLHALSLDGLATIDAITSGRGPRAEMERIYSAFFTSERRREPQELTAAALELHNETQKAHKPLLPRPGADGGRRRPDADADESMADAKRHAAARRQDLQQLTMDWASVKKDLEAACQAAARAFLLAYGAKAFTAVLLASRKWSSLEYGYADAARLLLRGDTLRFGAFFGSLVGIFRVTELVTRAARGGQRDAVNLAIAGAVSGSALLLDSPSRRNTISLYIFVRMLDVGYYQWICRIGAVNHHGLEYTVRQRMRGQLDAHGKPLPFRLCQPHYHMYAFGAGSRLERRD